MAKRKKLKPIWKFLFVIIIVVGLVIFGIKYSNKDTDDNKPNIIEKIINKEPDKKKVNLTLIGDIMFEGLYLDSINQGDDPNTYLSKSDKEFQPQLLR